MIRAQAVQDWQQLLVALVLALLCPLHREREGVDGRMEEREEGTNQRRSWDALSLQFAP
jgi:hypothetical protein